MPGLVNPLMAAGPQPGMPPPDPRNPLYMPPVALERAAADAAGGGALPGAPSGGGNPLMAPPQAAPAMAPPPPARLPEAFERSQEGLQDRVSTRIPTSAKLKFDPHTRAGLSIGRLAMLPEGFVAGSVDPKHADLAKEGINDAMAKHADLIRDEYPFIDTTDLGHHGVLEKFVQHAHDNIVALWNQVKNEPWRDQAADWYRGANRMAGDLGARYGVSKRQAAAVIASLSPQKDWDQNLSLAERVLHAHANQQDVQVTPEMRGFMQKMVDARKDTTRAALDMMVNGGKDAKTGQVYEPIKEGQAYRDIADPVQKALFIRAHDELHSPDRGYDIISPSGERTRAKTPDGKADAPASWGSFSEIANAVRAAQSQDHLPTISRALGAKHKVRSFYNNIVSPDAAAYLPQEHHDVTADTHAINVGLMLPMGSKARPVLQGLAAGGNVSAPAYSGAQGLYGLHADAYRRAADTISQQEGRRFLPREVQSVTWEAIRGLWQKEHKKLDASGMPMHEVGKVAHGAAYAVRHGWMSPEMAHQAIVQAAGGVRPPRWHAPAAAGAA